MKSSLQKGEAMASMGKKRTSGEATKGIAPIILFALFVILLLLALVSGLRSYASEVASSDESKATRLSVGFLTNTVRSFDSSGFICTGDGPEGEALVLAEHTPAGVFETRIYAYQGNLLQEYALADAAYSPESATVLFPTDEFNFSVDGDLLTIQTQAGTANVALRSADPIDPEAVL